MSSSFSLIALSVKCRNFLIKSLISSSSSICLKRKQNHQECLTQIAFSQVLHFMSKIQLYLPFKLFHQNKHTAEKSVCLPYSPKVVYNQNNKWTNKIDKIPQQSAYIMWPRAINATDSYTFVKFSIKVFNKKWGNNSSLRDHLYIF